MIWIGILLVAFGWAYLGVMGKRVIERGLYRRHKRRKYQQKSRLRHLQ